MAEINSLKQKKEELFGHKRELLDKRKESIVKLRALQTEISEVKNQRNQFNQLVQENKKSRLEADARIKKLSKEIQAMRQSNSAAPIPGRLPDIEKSLKSLEWKYQTQALTPAADKKMSKQIKELRDHLEALREREKMKSGVMLKHKDLSDIQKEQKIYHLNVLTNAERSEAKHQELLALYQRADAFKKEKDELDQKLGPIANEISNIKGALQKEFDSIKQEQKKEEAHVQAAQDKILDEKVKLVKEKIKNGKKLTTADILVIQHADIDI